MHSGQGVSVYAKGATGRRGEAQYAQDSLTQGFAAFTGVPADDNIAISTDGRGAWIYTIFVERLWRMVPVINKENSFRQIGTDSLPSEQR